MVARNLLPLQTKSSCMLIVQLLEHLFRSARSDGDRAYYRRRLLEDALGVFRNSWESELARESRLLHRRPVEDRGVIANGALGLLHESGRIYSAKLSFA